MKINLHLKNIGLFFLFFGTILMAQEKPLLIQKVNPNLYVHTTYNVFEGTKISANGMYLVTKEGVILFDTPWDKTQYQTILDTIQDRHHLPVIAVFATHFHNDRTGGFDYYNKLGIVTYATKQTNDILKKNNQVTSTKQIELGKVYRFGGEKFVIEYFGEGHTTDNTVVWFPKYRILDGGCLVKNVEAKNLGNIEDANVKAWPITIDRLMKKHSKIVQVIPGHENWYSNGHLENTIKLLNEK